MKRTIILLALLVVVALALGACGYNAAVQAEQQATTESQTQLIKNQPIPKFEWSQDRDTFIQIYQMKNEARNTYTSVDSMSGQHIFDCPSVGYPIPADTQLTNPLQTIYNSSSSAVVEQPEPNGLYSSKNTDATYILCVRKNGDVVPIYTEQKATVWPFQVNRMADGSFKEVESSPSSSKLKIGNKK